MPREKRNVISSPDAIRVHSHFVKKTTTSDGLHVEKIMAFVSDVHEKAGSHPV
jgi:hypothetical protein